MFVEIDLRSGAGRIIASFDTYAAADVVTEAEDVWRRRFACDPTVTVTVVAHAGSEHAQTIAGPCRVPDLAHALVGVRGL